MSVRPNDLVFYAGGDCFARFGTLVWRPTMEHDTPPTHTRTGDGAMAVGSTGQLRGYTASHPRISWPLVDGVRVPAYLGEAARTNKLLRSEALDNASWTKTATSISADAAGGPDGAVSLDRITEDGTTGTHDVRQAVTGMTADASYALSGWFKISSRSWVRLAVFETATTANFFRAWFNLSTGEMGTTDDGGTATVGQAYVEDWTHIAAGLYRLVVTGSVGNSATAVTVQAALATGDAVTSYAGDGTSNLFGGYLQLEDAATVASSYIPTTTAAVARGADVILLPWTSYVGAGSWYVKFIERGTTLTSGFPRIWEIQGPTTGKQLNVRHNTGSAGGYGFAYEDGDNSDTTGGLAGSTSPEIGDVVELLLTADDAGDFQLTQSINGGAAVSTTKTATARGFEDWTGSPSIQFGSAVGGSPSGQLEILSFKHAASVHSLADMQAVFP